MRCYQNLTQTLGKLIPTIILSLAINAVLAGAENAISWPGIQDLSRFLQVLGPTEIGEPELIFFGKRIVLKFNFSDQIVDGSLSLDTFGDRNCTININGNDYLVPQFRYDENPSPDGTKNREIELIYDVDPVKVQQSSIWRQNEDDQFFMDFCFIIQLFSGPVENPTSQLLDTLETEINLRVDLFGDFGADFEVLPRDPLQVEDTKQFFVEGYICDEGLEPVVLSEPQTQGSVVRVCVVPDPEARDAGIYIRRIDSFSFIRTDLPDGSTVSQEAVRDGQSVNPDFTSVFCAPGSEVCIMETLLKADFYTSPGEIFGYGEAWLQFGTESIRKLQYEVEDSSRMLQEVEGVFVGTTSFSIDFIVLPGVDENFFGALAFECDEENKRLEERPAKQFGDTIRVCVVPDEVSNQFDIRIKRIDVWNWTKAPGLGDGLDSDVFQASVEEGGIQAEDGLTVLVCFQGSTLCIFKTQFADDFYDSSGEIIGIGDVILQYPEQITSRVSRRNLQASLSSSALMMEAMGNRSLQDISQSGIAGISRVIVNTTSEFASIDDRVPGGCDYNHTVADWWEEEDKNDQYMYIGIATGIILSLGCSFLACWMYPHCRRNDESSGGKRGAINVNVDLKNENKENITSEDAEEYDRRSDTSSASSNRSLPDGSDDNERQKRKSKRSSIRRSSDDLESSGKKGKHGSKRNVKKTIERKTVSKSSTKRSFKR